MIGCVRVLYSSLSIPGRPIRVKCWGVVGIALGVSLLVAAGAGMCRVGWVLERSNMSCKRSPVWFLLEDITLMYLGESVRVTMLRMSKNRDGSLVFSREVN